MKFENLNLDVLRMIFSRACNEKWDGRNAVDSYREMVTLSSTSHLWRLVVLPYLYKRIHVYCDHGKVFSNAKLAIDNGFLDYARVLKVKVACVGIEYVDLLKLLNKAGIDKVIWTKVYKLEIDNYDKVRFGGSDDLDMDYEEDFESTFATAKKIVDYFCKHVPGLKYIEYDDDLSMVRPARDCEYVSILLSELFKRYSEQITASSMFLVPDRLTKPFTFPQHLAHLSLDMDGYEKKLLSRVFAPSLQSLEIVGCSPDITWSWFDSGDGNDIWFHSLKKLSIIFDETRKPLASYHNGKYSSRKLTKLKSDYCSGAAKKAHFPVLQCLKVWQMPYPFKDGSFYKLFQDCPLEYLVITTPQGTDYDIPPRMLANLKYMNVAINLDSREHMYTEGPFGNDPHLVPFYRKMDYTHIFVNLTGTKSTATDITVTAEPPHNLTLQEGIVWKSVQRLSLRLKTDLGSILCTLVDLPKLCYFECWIQASNLKHLCTSYIARGKRISDHIKESNTRVEHMAVKFIMDDELHELTILFFLSELLVIVPSLLKLEVNKEVLMTTREALSQLTCSSGCACRNVKVVAREHWDQL